MDRQEQMFLEVEAWRLSGMTKQEFAMDKASDISVILSQRKEDYNKTGLMNH